MATAFGIELKHSTPYHHQGNAIVERSIQTLKDKIAMFMAGDDHNEWDDHIGMAVLSINAIKHSTTQYSPYETIFGRKLRLPREPIEITQASDTYAETLQTQLELIRRKISESMAMRGETSKKYYDAKHQERKFSIDDEVLVRFEPKGEGVTSKFTSNYKGPYRVVDVKANDIYKLELIGKKRLITAHVSRIKLYKRDERDDNTTTAVAIDLDEEDKPTDEPTNKEPTSRRKQRLTARNYLVLAALFQLCIITTASNVVFIPTDTVLWNPSQANVVSGLTHYTVEWTAQDPCKILFENATSDPVINKNLLDHCSKKFFDKIT